LDEYQLETWGDLRTGEERAVGDWLCTGPGHRVSETRFGSHGTTKNV